ncbi:hypothetical protein FRC16_005186 [Serendipita sp. 398]|nr:hypothetical protein FRC16_005186 [Serendipita sp. 398]
MSSAAAAEAALQQLGVTRDQAVEFHRLSIQGNRLLHASLTLLVYDFCLTFAQEVKYVWTQGERISIAKLLFFLNRYWPIANYIVRTWVLNQKVLTRYVCYSISTLKVANDQLRCWSSVELLTYYEPQINFAIVEIVLMLRVWALYERSRKIGIALSLLFVVGLSASFALRKSDPGRIKFAPTFPDSLTVCSRSSPNEYFFLYGIGLIIETTIFVLLVKRAWPHVAGPLKTPVVNALLTQGTAYYVAVLLTLIVVIMFRPIADSNLIVVATSIACNRLILSFRGFYFKQYARATTLNTTAPSATRRLGPNSRPTTALKRSFGHLDTGVEAVPLKNLRTTRKTSKSAAIPTFNREENRDTWTEDDFGALPTSRTDNKYP